MRLGRPLAAASAVAAMTGASLIASPALANSSNRNSPSTPSSSSSPAPSSTAEATPAPSSTTQPGSAPSSTAEATPAPGKTSEGSSFKITQEKTFVSASSNTSFTVSGTGCTGKQATVGIALYAPDGTVSDVVKTEAASDGSWTSDLDLAALIKSIGTSAATTTEGWKIGAGCTTNGGKTEMAQVTTQQQTQIYFDDTRITGSYEVSARTESQAQTFTFNAQGFYASETVTVVLKSKSDSSITYTLGELTVDANGNLTGNLPAPADAANGEYLLVLTGSHHSETATSQTVTTVSNHTFTVESTEQKVTEQQTTEQKAAEQQTTEQQTTEQKAAEQQTTEQKAAEQKASENNGGGNKQAGGNNGGNNSNANAGDKQANAGGKQAGGDNKGGTDQKVNNLNSNAKESSSDNRAGGETTKDSDRSLAHTGANGMIFGGIAAFLAVAGGAALVLRRRNKA